MNKPKIKKQGTVSVSPTSIAIENFVFDCSGVKSPGLLDIVLPSGREAMKLATKQLRTAIGEYPGEAK